MLRCINCHLNVDRMLRHVVSSLDSTLQTLLSAWTSLLQIPPDAVICQECFLRLSVHCRNRNMNAEREFGHTHVCVGCGKSLLESRRHVRHHTVEANDPLVAIILSWDPHNEVISRDAIVCHLCWMRASHPEVEHSQEMAGQIGGNYPFLKRGRIKSRHVGQRHYFTYISFDREPSSSHAIDQILGYCCSCVVGNRTVGCCCHVMTLIWYLGWARHQTNIDAPAAFLDNILISDED